LKGTGKTGKISGKAQLGTVDSRSKAEEETKRSGDQEGRAKK